MDPQKTGKHSSNKKGKMKASKTRNKSSEKGTLLIGDDLSQKLYQTMEKHRKVGEREMRRKGEVELFMGRTCTYPITAYSYHVHILLLLTHIMAYGSYAICRDGPEKNGGHIKSAQMTRSICLR